MPNINIEIDDELLIAVNVARSREAMTQKDWILRELRKAAEDGERDRRAGDRDAVASKRARLRGRAVIEARDEGGGAVAAEKKSAKAKQATAARAARQ